MDSPLFCWHLVEEPFAELPLGGFSLCQLSSPLDCASINFDREIVLPDSFPDSSSDSTSVTGSPQQIPLTLPIPDLRELNVQPEAKEKPSSKKRKIDQASESDSNSSSPKAAEVADDVADEDDEQTKRRKLLDHKAQLARTARSRKNMRLQTLEIENQNLRRELAAYQSNVHLYTKVPEKPRDSNELFSMLITVLMNNPEKRKIFAQLLDK